MLKFSNPDRDVGKLEGVIVRLLARQQSSLATAESCTGGFIANRITNVPGASEVFPGGIIAYSNAVKQKALGVRAQTLQQHGAVSEPVAREMAEGARRKFGADFAIAVTGIAGPGGGSKVKPVGTAFIALTGAFGTMVVRKFNAFPREKFKRITADQALKLLFLRLTRS